MYYIIYLYITLLLIVHFYPVEYKPHQGRNVTPDD